MKTAGGVPASQVITLLLASLAVRSLSLLLYHHSISQEVHFLQLHFLFLREEEKRHFIFWVGDRSWQKGNQMEKDPRGYRLE